MIYRDSTNEQIPNLLINRYDPKMLRAFLTHIFQDLQKKCGKSWLSLYAFQEFLRFPMILTEKLFQILNKSKTGCLSQEEFEDGLVLLYSGSIEKKLKLIFDLFDFDHDGVTSIEDITLLLSHCHMMDQTLDILPLLEDLIYSSFVPFKTLEFKDFSEITFQKKKADIFFVVLLFLEKHKPFSDYQLLIFANHHQSDNFFKCSTTKDTLEMQSHYPHPSKKFIRYAKQLYIEFIEEESIENELNDLDAFESNLVDVLSAFEKTNKMIQDSHSQVNILLKNGNDSQDSKLLSFFTRKRGSLGSTSTQISQSPSVEFHQFDYWPLTGKDLNEINLFTLQNNQLVECKLTLVDDSLFYYEFTNGKSIQLVDVISLKSTFVRTCQKITIDSQTYFPFQLVSYYGMNELLMTYMSTDENAIKSFVKSIKVNINYRKVEDYYRIEEEIGKGQFGQVRLGVKISTNEKVAIKIVAKTGENKDEEDYKYAKWEVDIFNFLRNASHPGIIKPIEMFETSINIIFIYEYAAGGDLKTFVSQKAELLSPKELIEFSKQILSAVGFLHKFGIIHRDLKLTNILLSKKLSGGICLKIIDFGFSKVMARNERSAEMLGSLNYTAPEIIKNKSYNHQVDVWSIGVIIYFLTFGGFPFPHSDNLPSFGKLKEGIVYDTIYFPEVAMGDKKGEYEPIVSLIQACLNKRPEFRPLLETLKLVFV